MDPRFYSRMQTSGVEASDSSYDQAPAPVPDSSSLLSSPPAAARSSPMAAALSPARSPSLTVAHTVRTSQHGGITVELAHPALLTETDAPTDTDAEIGRVSHHVRIAPDAYREATDADVEGEEHTEARGQIEAPSVTVPGANEVEPVPTLEEFRQQIGHTGRRTRPKQEKKKGSGKSGGPMLRTWLRVNKDGDSSLLQADKYKLTHKLGVQTRDLRLLDPIMANMYPSCLLCRDKAIVVNLEALKLIITTQFVLVVNPEDEMVTKFVAEFKQRLLQPNVAPSRSFAALKDLASKGGAVGALAGTYGGQLESAEYPFELKTLEVALDMIANQYNVLTSELEASAYPALDGLAARVSSANLERVRRIKNSLVRLNTRVETMREVLEKFLNDDTDMHALNLTAKEMHEEQDLRKASLRIVAVEEGGEKERHSGSSSSSSSDSSEEEEEVAQVEMLLETYFMHFDNTWNRLQTLNEYIGDTEDLVNIKLDQHRNRLITTDLLLTAFSLSIGIVTVIGGIFGMNLDNGMQEDHTIFLEVTIISCVGALLLFASFCAWCWQAELLVY